MLKSSQPQERADNRQTRKLLDHTDRLPLLEQQVMAQQATIQTLQQQARLAQKLSAMEQ